jgi:hypothetical protein
MGRRSLSGRLLVVVVGLLLALGPAACADEEAAVVDAVEAVTGQQIPPTPTAEPVEEAADAPVAEAPTETPAASPVTPTATPTEEPAGSPLVVIEPLPDPCAGAMTLDLPDSADPEIVSSLAIVGGGGGDWDGAVCDGGEAFPAVEVDVERALTTSTQVDYDVAVGSIDAALTEVESGAVGGGDFGGSQAAMSLGGNAAALGDGETSDKATDVAKDVFADEAEEQLAAPPEFAMSDLEMFLDIAADAQRWGDIDTADRALAKAREIYEQLAAAQPGAATGDPCQFDLENLRDGLELVELGQRLGASEEAVDGAKAQARAEAKRVATAMNGGAEVELNRGELNQIEGSLDMELSEDEEEGEGCSPEWLLTSVLDASLGMLFVGASGTLTTEVALTVDAEGVVSGSGSQTGVIVSTISVPGTTCTLTMDYTNVPVEVTGNRILAGEEIALKLSVKNLGGSMTITSNCPDMEPDNSVMAATTPLTIEARDGAAEDYSFFGVAEITYLLTLP